MRLNLAEIALSLGCGPDRVIWTDAAQNAFQAASGFERSGGESPSPLRSLVRERAPDGGGLSHAGGRDPGWGHAPWAQLVPTGAQIDSRKVRPGQLFFCLPGERTDGHAFAADAAASGAIAIIAARDPLARDREQNREGGRGPGRVPSFPPVFLVEDVAVALGRLAMCHRDTCLARVIGITGTAGKTSVKEVLARVLEMHGRTERNPMNLNNLIGMPLSMLNASADASFWVMEMGISQEGDMDALGRILRPDVGILLNVGDGHVSGLGAGGVAANKARLLEYVQPGGLAFISADYPELDREIEDRSLLISRKGLEILRFSYKDRAADSFAEYTEPGLSGGVYLVGTSDVRLSVDTPFLGEFGSENVAAIAGVAIKLGLPPEEIRTGFSTARLPDQRFSAARYPGLTILDDSYNANPLSSFRMLQAARTMADEQGQRLVLVMGEMGELGDKAAASHLALGREMALARPEAVFWKGGSEREVRRGLDQGGYGNGFFPLCSIPEFAMLLEEFAFTDVLVLFKGSRKNQLEQFVAVLREKTA